MIGRPEASELSSWAAGGKAWEEKVNNFFLKVKDPTAHEHVSSVKGAIPTQGNSLAAALRSAQDKSYECL